MQFEELETYVNNHEVVIVDNINGEEPEKFVKRHPELFQKWTVEDDADFAGVLFMYDPALRAQHEYNPEGK